MIPKHIHLLFENLVQAADAGVLCVVESRDRKTGEPRWVIAAVDREKAGTVLIYPFGHISETAFDDYVDPVTCREEGT